MAKRTPAITKGVAGKSRKCIRLASKNISTRPIIELTMSKIAKPKILYFLSVAIILFIQKNKVYQLKTRMFDIALHTIPSYLNLYTTLSNPIDCKDCY